MSNKKIYKYIGPETLEIVFKKEGVCGFKFSYPKDYNDPYELFLTIDFNDDPEIIAFYKETVQDVHQFPTTCFSNSPIVTPMWAHYAHNSKGFVIEIDEDTLREHLSDAKLEDVSYQDSPRSELETTFAMAYRRGKPRDIMFLRNGVQYAAYFTKNKCWSYELERRLVVSDEDIEDIKGNMILFLPVDCVTAIIAGPRTKQSYKDIATELCNTLGTQYLEANIGKSTSKPFLLDECSNTHVFNGDNIVSCHNYCSDCKEPVAEGKDICSWCSISEEDQVTAASGNPLRALDDAGILQDYIQGFNKIGK